MWKAMISALAVGIVTVAGLPAISSYADAADLAVPVQRSAAHDCGSCGCLHTSYVYHRELRTTFGIGFDPRNYDATEPHYYFGPVRAYPRYSVAAD